MTNCGISTYIEMRTLLFIVYDEMRRPRQPAATHRPHMLLDSRRGRCVTIPACRRFGDVIRNDYAKACFRYDIIINAGTTLARGRPKAALVRHASAGSATSRSRNSDNREFGLQNSEPPRQLGRSSIFWPASHLWAQCHSNLNALLGGLIL